MKTCGVVRKGEGWIANWWGIPRLLYVSLPICQLFLLFLLGLLPSVCLSIIVILCFVHRGKQWGLLSGQFVPMHSSEEGILANSQWAPSFRRSKPLCGRNEQNLLDELASLGWWKIVGEFVVEFEDLLIKKIFALAREGSMAGQQFKEDNSKSPWNRADLNDDERIIISTNWPPIASCCDFLAIQHLKMGWIISSFCIWKILWFWNPPHLTGLISTKSLLGFLGWLIEI